MIFGRKWTATIGGKAAKIKSVYEKSNYVACFGWIYLYPPTIVSGFLTLHGVTQPLVLTITKFKCIPDHPLLKREVCGADAIGVFDRSTFGIAVGQRYGFTMGVTLRIQVEAIKREAIADR